MPEPLFWMALEARTRQDRDKLFTTLGKLSVENPTLRVRSHPETGYAVIAALSELQLNGIVDCLRHEYEVGFTAGRPQVACHEMIRQAARAREPFQAKMATGRSLVGDVELIVAPLPSGTGVEFEWRVPGTIVPGDYASAVETGVREALEHGVIANHRVVDVKVVAVNGSYDDVGSNGLASKVAAHQTTKAALRRARPQLFEPIMAIEVVTAREVVGLVIGDLTRRRSCSERLAPSSSRLIVRAQVPLAELIGYAANLKTITQGRASCSMRFSQYQPVR